MRSLGDGVTLGRSRTRALGLLVCLLLLSALLPLSVLAAPEGRPRNYVVTLAVPNAEQTFRASNRVTRQRIRSRAERAANVTDRLARQHDFRTRFRFERTAPGFSARLTPSQAADVARDEKVATVRPARRFKPANQVTPSGVKRIKAAPEGSPGPDVDVDIAILDTGIGPVGGNELNVAGGFNCSGVGAANDWADSIGSRHGTHVAGTAAARDNDIGVVGVAPGARLWSVRVFDGPFGDEATIVCGLQWAIATHDGPNAPAGSQPIEVINMSLQGPRGTVVEECPGATGDIIHQAICEAVDVGITVVVAAGNNGSDTRKVSPAGYDQVITVAALSDFDGLGNSQSGSNCSLYQNEKDDTFARYSNFGADVDILAPGTCVESTTVSGDGTATKRLTGTSMASPHVAGAVALYLADHPNATPDKMRKLVRASGRLDWRAQSDPHWSGVSDRDEPNRVLDVKAMTGGDGVKVWLFHEGFKVGGKKGTTRSTRVDVQRAGGYAGDVNLSVAGLPGAVGNASFSQNGLSGLTGLGTTVKLDLKKNGPDGNYDLEVKASGPGGDPSGSRPLALRVDRSGPAVAHLGARIRAGNVKLANRGAAQTIIGWEADDVLSSVSKVVLQRKVRRNSWKRLGARNGGSARVTLKPGQANRFRVVATDSLGNRTTTAGVGTRLSVRDSESSQLQLPASGGWKQKTVRKAYGGSLLMAADAAGSISTSFKGKAFAIVAPVGPNRGTIRLRVDGGDWQEVSLKATKGSQKRVVFSRRVENGIHQLDIQGLEGLTAIDAVLIVR